MTDRLQLAPENLSANERTIFGLMTTDDPVHIDSLAEETKLSIPNLTSALLGLEMRELIRQIPRRTFIRKQ